MLPVLDHGMTFMGDTIEYRYQTLDTLHTLLSSAQRPKQRACRAPFRLIEIAYLDTLYRPEIPEAKPPTKADRPCRSSCPPTRPSGRAC